MFIWTLTWNRSGAALLKWGWDLIPLLSSLGTEAPCGIFWCPGNTCENHGSRTSPRPVSWGTKGCIVQSHMGDFICFVPELEGEPNSPTLVFFPLSTASPSPLMHFYYKMKAFQSLVFCSSFPPPPRKYIYLIPSDELSTSAPSKPCWTHSHVITVIIVPAIKTAAEKESDGTLWTKRSIWTGPVI